MIFKIRITNIEIRKATRFQNAIFSKTTRETCCKFRISNFKFRISYSTPSGLLVRPGASRHELHSRLQKLNPFGVCRILVVRSQMLIEFVIPNYIQKPFEFRYSDFGFHIQPFGVCRFLVVRSQMLIEFVLPNLYSEAFSNFDIRISDFIFNPCLRILVVPSQMPIEFVSQNIVRSLFGFRYSTFGFQKEPFSDSIFGFRIYFQTAIIIPAIMHPTTLYKLLMRYRANGLFSYK